MRPVPPNKGSAGTRRRESSGRVREGEQGMGVHPAKLSCSSGLELPAGGQRTIKTRRARAGGAQALARAFTCSRWVRGG